MMRKCHSNTCPVGIATQRGDLRKKFTGKPEHLVNYFTFMVEGLREIMAELGFRTINEMVGQSQCLKFKDDIDHWKYKNLDLSPILYKQEEGAEEGLYKTQEQDHLMDNILDWKLLEVAKPALEKGEKVSAEFNVINTDRALGAVLSNEIAKKFEAEGLPEGTIHFKLNGSVGQSCGAFLSKGVELEVEGDCNDYFGKGLSGGQLILYPNKGVKFKAEENIIVGNVCFYGATAGKAFIRGIAGERFCVRNSGAEVVVEGIGDHGCEYMTGGKAIILGKTGRNFGAGMSGGIAYVLDEDGSFPHLCNLEMTQLETLEDIDEIMYLKAMIEEHKAKTGSAVAERLLSDWDNAVPKFVKVIPTDYKKMMGLIEEVRQSGKYESEDDIVEAAFQML